MEWMNQMHARMQNVQKKSVIPCRRRRHLIDFHLLHSFRMKFHKLGTHNMRACEVEKSGKWLDEIFMRVFC